jgi:hypothetical protein
MSNLIRRYISLIYALIAFYLVFLLTLPQTLKCLFHEYPRTLLNTLDMDSFHIFVRKILILILKGLKNSYTFEVLKNARGMEKFLYPPKLRIELLFLRQV